MSREEPARSGSGLSPALAGGIVFGLLGISALIGRRNAPDPSHPKIRRWYRELDKPAFTPPDAAFGAVWPVLETGMAIGGYRLLRRPPSPNRNAAVGLWLVTTGMIGGWTQLFFRQRALGGSAVASGALLATATTYVATSSRIDRFASATALPLVGWLAFATLLATDVWRRNRSDPQAE